jgi:glycosyltransferase involved in cell wall biosynthesis
MNRQTWRKWLHEFLRGYQFFKGLKIAMHLSVIVPIRGTQEKLNKFLNGVLLQRLERSKFDLIVVDDGSSPSLDKIFNEFKERFENGQAAFIRHEENQGRAKARNSGILKAVGDVQLFVDVDNVPTPDAFEVILEQFADGELKAVRGNVRCKIDAVSKSAYTHFFDQRYLGARGVTSGPLLYRYFASDALAISRLVLEQVGYFDEQFRAYGCEDEELGCRVKSHGIPFYFASNAVFEDVDRPTLRRKAKRMFDYSCYSLPVLLNKHPDYAAQCLFPQLECTNSPVGRLKRWLLLFALNRALAELLMCILDFFDSRVTRMPSILFYYVIASFYVDGYKNRRA